MSQRTFPRGSENRKYRSSYFYKERYVENLNKRDDTNKEDSFKNQRRETLRDLTYKYTKHLNITNNTINTNNEGRKNLLSSYVKVEKNDQNDKIEDYNNNKKFNLDTNKFFNELSKEKSIIQNKFDKKIYSKIDKIIEVENYFEKIYGKNKIKGMTIEFYDLESIKDTKLYIPEWILKDNSEKLFEMELSPQDITVYNLWFFRRKNEGSPDFVHKGIIPISNDDILLHLENIYNVSREEKRSGTNRTGSRMIRLILDGLRKVNNYMLYIGSETRYPNNVMEKTPRLIEKFEKILENIRSYKNYEGSKYMANDEKAIKYAKELLDVVWMNFNVRTMDDSENRVIFRKSWIGVNKELEEIIEKYFHKK